MVRVKLFLVAAGDTSRGNGHRLWFGKFKFCIRAKLLPYEVMQPREVVDSALRGFQDFARQNHGLT